MFYYKRVCDGVLDYLEECVMSKAAVDANVAEISESEYRGLLADWLGDVSEVDEFQRGYEQALLDMAEVGV